MFQGNGEQNDLMRLVRAAGIYLGVFLFGGIFAFAYSYSPLHNAKNWKIDYLSGRLEAQTARLSEVTSELEGLKADSESRPDAETFGMLQNELASSDKTVSELERQLDKAEQRVKELERSRNNWRAKAKTAESKSEALAAELSITPKVEDPPMAPVSGAVPAAPADAGAGEPVPAVSAPLQ